MKRTKSQNPVDRVGIYRRIDEIPAQHLLAQYQTQYQGRNIWDEFCSEFEYQQCDSPRFRQSVDRVGTHWKAHMSTQRGHHALATPQDVEDWCQCLLENKARSTAYNYWLRLRRFYEWLQWHTEHPHRYSPVMLAVIAGGASREIWDVKLEKWGRVREQYSKAGTDR